MRDIDRRSALLQGATAAALTAAALAVPSTVAGAQQQAEPSALFAEYLRRREEFDAFFALPEATTEPPEWSDRQGQMHDYLGEIVVQIKARKPASFAELVEMGRVAIVEMDPIAERAFEFERSLARAILALADGGTNG